MFCRGHDHTTAASAGEAGHGRASSGHRKGARPGACRAALLGSLAALVLLPFAAVSEDQALTTTNRPPPFARGTINKLDQYHKTLSILPRSGDAEEDFLWTARTVIYLGPERLTADKLRPGDEIAIRHQTDADGKRLIVRMKVYREGIPRTALDKTEP